MCSKLEQQPNQHLLQFHPSIAPPYHHLCLPGVVVACLCTRWHLFPSTQPHTYHSLGQYTLYCNLLPFLPQHSGLIPLTLGEWGIHEYIFSYRRHRHCHHHHIHLLHCTISSWSREIKATTPNFSIRSANRSPYQRPTPQLQPKLVQGTIEIPRTNH